MTNEDLIKIGFKELPHYTVAGSIIYDLGRHRQLSAGCVGTPNEMVFICEIDHKDEKKITDLVCLHNYDYDGYLTETKIKTIIMAITGRTDFECAEPARATNKTTDAMVEYAKNLALDFVVWKDSQYKNIDCFYSDEELFLLFQKTR